MGMNHKLKRKRKDFYRFTAMFLFLSGLWLSYPISLKNISLKKHITKDKITDKAPLPQIDPYYNQSTSLTVQTGETTYIPVQEDKGMKNINFTISQINQTSNTVNNTKMNPITQEAEPLWCFNETHTQTNGLNLSYSNINGGNIALNFTAD